MAVNLADRAKAMFERAFPERQIYHRSGGAVRFVTISPWRQAMFAGGATAFLIWCLFATVSVVIDGAPGNGASAAEQTRLAAMQRELQDARTRKEIAEQLLAERTAVFEKELEELQGRHDTIKRLVAHLQADGAAGAALSGDGRDILVDASIEEADARQSRPVEAPGGTGARGGFRAKFDAMKSEQASLLDRAEEEAVQRSERAQGVLRFTGLPVGRLADENGMGGPLIELSAATGAFLASSAGADDAFAARVEEVAARLEDARRFETVIHKLPLGAPVTVPGVRETSGFGLRSDPFTRRRAWHDGADLAAYYGAPILATAPGLVTFSGSKSGYGRVVEVDHGNGFKTRYAHLQSILVRAGAKVALGQKVGTMGSTGRSTGPHLHYEVDYKGKSYDPIKFLRAGKHVY
jgi:murein DD-endopeptidase MepM/ murein hydrolase activator NlpD